MRDNRLHGRVALVTGAGTGMGLATARLLADAGARVVLVGRSAPALEAATAQIAATGGAAQAYPCDVTSPEQATELMAWVERELGGVDILINNAGASSRVRNPLYLEDDELQGVLDVNLIAVFRLVRLALPGMLERGHGTILTVSSLSALQPGLLGGAAYSAAKAAVRTFMEFVHNTFRQQGIRAITVIPGEADTPILDARPRPPSGQERADMLQPDDVAEAILMAVALPDRACAQEIVIIPTRTRDTSADLALNREIGAPAP